MTTGGSSVQPHSMRSSSSPEDDLRNFEQEVDILGESGTTAKHDRLSADERIANRSGVERLGQRFDGPYGIAWQEVGVNLHDVL